MSCPLSLSAGDGITPVSVMNRRISPHPVLHPMGEGTPELAAAGSLTSALPRGEGEGEGREFRIWRNRAASAAYISALAERSSFLRRRLAP